MFSNELNPNAKNNEEDSKYPLGFDDSDEDKDDYTIRDTDAMIVAASVEGDFSSLEVYVFEENTSTLYVHHDIMLSSFPLCLEWLPYSPGSLTTGGSKGNYIIVGSFLPEIEIWNLDELNALQPKFLLGGSIQSKKKGKHLKQKTQYIPGSHTDAVMSLSLNPSRNYILASGSADTSVKIWDLNKQNCLYTSNHHEGKVQSVKWHPSEEGIMATASFDNRLCLMDVKENKVKLERDMNSEIEGLTWHPHNQYLLSVAAENGMLETHDLRKFTASPLVSFKAHKKAISSVACSPGIKNLFVTTSEDKFIKVWDYSCIEDKKPKLVAENDPDMGELYCCQFYRDSPWFISVGGSKGEVYVWDLESNGNIASVFGGKVEKNTESMDTGPNEIKVSKKKEHNHKTKHRKE